MGRTRFAPPALESTVDVTPGALPRPTFERQPATHGTQYRRYSLADGAGPSTDGLRRVDSPGPAANDMGPNPELAAMRDEARSAGQAEGLEMGLSQARAQTEATLERYAQALDALEALHGEVVDSYRRALIDVAAGVAEAAIQRSIDKDTVRALAEQALAAFAGDEVDRMELRLGPADAERLGDWIQARRAAGLDLIVHVDETMEDGDLSARCSAGSLETRLRDRLARALEAVRGATTPIHGDPDAPAPLEEASP